MSSTCCTPPPFVPPAVPPPDGALKTVVLIGPPNSGKSTLFNRLTGLRQKVANFPGVTVEQRLGLMAGVGRDDLTLIDLPGIYSLTPYSEDARVSIDVLRGKMPGTPKPDAVILVLDSLHLTRQLMLAAPVLAVGLPTLVLLNMSDLMEARGGHIDTLKLARELGAPVAQISAVHGTGLEAVPLFLNQQTERKAAKPLALPVLGNAASTHSWAAQVSRRTGYQAPLSAENTRKIDNVLLHRIWGPLLFLIVVVGVFEVVFSIGQPMSDGFGDNLSGDDFEVGGGDDLDAVLAGLGVVLLDLHRANDGVGVVSRGRVLVGNGRFLHAQISGPAAENAAVAGCKCMMGWLHPDESASSRPTRCKTVTAGGYCRAARPCRSSRTPGENLHKPSVSFQ